MANALAKAPLVKGIALNMADRLSPYIAKAPAYKLNNSSFYIKTGTTPYNYVSKRISNAVGASVSNSLTGYFGTRSMNDYVKHMYVRGKNGKLRKASVGIGRPKITQFGDRKIN